MSAAHQATCVVIDGRAVLIEGTPGSGKSSLALALIDRGARLVGDDGVLLERDDGALFASPHPRTRGLLEARNLGLLPFPVEARVTVALVIVLDPDAPRYRDGPDGCERHGVALPLVRLTPYDPVLPRKAELALQHFGHEPPKR